MMDETRRAVLEAELGDALQEREKLNYVIAYLSGRLGIPEPSIDRFGSSAMPSPVVTASPPTPQPRADSGRQHPSGIVREGEFSDTSATKAVIAVLGRVGPTRPLKTRELFAAITKGGASVKDPGTLYRSIYRDPRIVRVGKALWGLAEWYPDLDADHASDVAVEADGEEATAEHEERPSEGAA